MKGSNLGFLDNRITLGLSKCPDFPRVNWVLVVAYLRQEVRWNVLTWLNLVGKWTHLGQQVITVPIWVHVVTHGNLGPWIDTWKVHGKTSGYSWVYFKYKQNFICISLLHLFFSEECLYFLLDSQRDTGYGKLWIYCPIVNGTNLSQSVMSLALGNARLKGRTESTSWSTLYKEY